MNVLNFMPFDLRSSMITAASGLLAPFSSFRLVFLRLLFLKRVSGHLFCNILCAAAFQTWVRLIIGYFRALGLHPFIQVKEIFVALYDLIELEEALSLWVWDACLDGWLGLLVLLGDTFGHAYDTRLQLRLHQGHTIQARVEADE